MDRKERSCVATSSFKCSGHDHLPGSLELRHCTEAMADELGSRLLLSLVIFT